MTKHNKQHMAFIESCNILNTLAKQYLEIEKKHKPYITSIFHSPSNSQKIANSIISVTDQKILASDFSAISFDGYIQFLYRLNEIYLQIRETLRRPHQVEDDFVDMVQGFFYQLKIILHGKLGGEIKNYNDINLNYIGYYLDAISAGLDCPENYMILKEQVLNLLNYHIHCYPKNPINRIIQPVFESINNDSKGINQHAETSEERFNNILKLLDELRMSLSDKHAKPLLSNLTAVIDNAMEYTRLNYDYSFSLPKGFP
jgi:hypothetical protein